MRRGQQVSSGRRDLVSGSAEHLGERPGIRAAGGGRAEGEQQPRTERRRDMVAIADYIVKSTCVPGN